MEEKKLTDEEVIKAMEICANWNSMSNCKDCPIGLDACCENQNVFAKYALDIIRRLQRENAILREAKTVYSTVDYCADDLAKALKTIAEQKAEIERLKIDIKNEKNWGKIQTKQAGQSTAKEILDKCIAIDKSTGGKGFVCIEAIAELAKGKGAEVE